MKLNKDWKWARHFRNHVERGCYRNSFLYFLLIPLWLPVLAVLEFLEI